MSTPSNLIEAADQAERVERLVRALSLAIEGTHHVVVTDDLREALSELCSTAEREAMRLTTLLNETCA